MATKDLLTALVAPGMVPGLPVVDLESAGGVVVADRVWGGEQADLVILASGAIRRLLADDLVQDPVPLFVSEVVLGLPVDADRPRLDTVTDLRAVVSAARRIGYSTGPSGEAFLALLADWGIRDMLSDRLVQAPPGVPVAQLIAEGRVDVGVQQASELAGHPDVAVLPFPEDARISTVFTGAVLVASTARQEAGHVLELLSHPAVGQVVRAHHMTQPAPSTQPVRSG